MPLLRMLRGWSVGPGGASRVAGTGVRRTRSRRPRNSRWTNERIAVDRDRFLSCGECGPVARLG